MEKWKRYEIGLFWFCVCNFITVTYLSLKSGMDYVPVKSLAVQYLLLIVFVCLLFKNRRMNQTVKWEVSQQVVLNPLDLKSHEKLHEQKRHYQVAAALIELGEKEQAVAYIETVLQEIS